MRSSSIRAVGVLIWLLVGATGALAQDKGGQTFSQEQLHQMLAPNRAVPGLAAVAGVDGSDLPG